MKANPAEKGRMKINRVKQRQRREKTAWSRRRERTCVRGSLGASSTKIALDQSCPAFVIHV